MDISKKLGEEIRGLRTDKLKLTQKELSEVVDVSIVYLSYLEQGKKSPSLKLLNKIYRLAGYKKLPLEIIEILKEVKKEKKAKSFNNAPTNIIYRLEEVGVYSYNQLTKLIKKDPTNIDLIYGMLSLLIESGDLAEAKKYLLQSLLHIENPEEKKWLEASYYELEANYPFAIQLLQEAIFEFSEKNTKQSKPQQKKNSSRLLFQLATIYFKYGQKLFYEDNQAEAIKYFHLSLEKHEELKKIANDPFYQMDYAGIFFWLALLGINPEEYWPKYIKEVKLALSLNFEQSLANFPIKSWKSLYSRSYIISAVSFLIRAYAEYSRIIKTTEDKRNLLREGEFLLAQYTPVEITPRENIFYRYYFNQACYHSIKAEVFASLDEDSKTELIYCGNVLKMITKNIQLPDREKFQQELKSSKGISFFRNDCTKEFKSILNKS